MAQIALSAFGRLYAHGDGWLAAEFGSVGVALIVPASPRLDSLGVGYDECIGRFGRAPTVIHVPPNEQGAVCTAIANASNRWTHSAGFTAVAETEGCGTAALNVTEARAPVGPLGVTEAITLSGVSRATLYRLLAVEPSSRSLGLDKRTHHRWKDADDFDGWFRRVQRKRDGLASAAPPAKATGTRRNNRLQSTRADGVVNWGDVKAELTGKPGKFKGHGRGKP